jgi:hypothetical protein
MLTCLLFSQDMILRRMTLGAPTQMVVCPPYVEFSIVSLGGTRGNRESGATGSVCVVLHLSYQEDINVLS